MEKIFKIILRHDTKLFRYVGMSLKFISYVVYVGFTELWKEPYIPGIEFCTVGLFGDTEP